MTDLEGFPIQALVALVDRETAIINCNTAEYGEAQFNPITPVYLELGRRFDNATKGGK